uniref:EF-hand domain-containing protein n=1 Tax=Ascaris lumbricoides TaxID=6252 RepID=A0A0M3HMQ5_ASCLU
MTTFNNMRPPWERLSTVFSKWDLAGFGEMDFEQLQTALLDSSFRDAVERAVDLTALQRLEYRATVDQSPLTYHEFTDIMTGLRRLMRKTARIRVNKALRYSSRLPGVTNGLH